MKRLLIVVFATGWILSSYATTPVVGGQKVVEGDLAAYSTVSFVDSSKMSDVCSGTLISRDLVISAAHCAPQLKRPLKIWVGTKDVGILMDIEKRVFHPMAIKFVEQRNWDDDLRQHDIQIIKLSKKVPAQFRPARILDTGFVIPEGTNLLIAGFGIDMVNEASSRDLLQARAPLLGVTQNRLRVDQRGGQGACFGDSGGPAYLETSTELFLAGVTHGPEFEYAPGCDNIIEIFMNASKFKDFILETAKELGASAPEFAVPL